MRMSAGGTFPTVNNASSAAGFSSTGVFFLDALKEQGKNLTVGSPSPCNACVTTTTTNNLPTVHVRASHECLMIFHIGLVVSNYSRISTFQRLIPRQFASVLLLLHPPPSLYFFLHPPSLPLLPLFSSLRGSGRRAVLGLPDGALQRCDFNALMVNNRRMFSISAPGAPCELRVLFFLLVLFFFLPFPRYTNFTSGSSFCFEPPKHVQDSGGGIEGGEEAHADQREPIAKAPPPLSACPQVRGLIIGVGRYGIFTPNALLPSLIKRGGLSQQGALAA